MKETCSDFATYLRGLQRRTTRTVHGFADRLGVDPTHVSRAMGKNSRPFDIRGLLKLALVTGENPSTVLRAAGKGDLANTIEELYGRPRPPISARERELRALWRLLEASGDEELMAANMTIIRVIANNVQRRQRVMRRQQRAAADHGRKKS